MHVYRTDEINDASELGEFTFAHGSGREIVLIATSGIGSGDYFREVGYRIENYPGLVVWEGRTRSRIGAWKPSYVRVAKTLGFAVRSESWNGLARRLLKAGRLIRGDLPFRQWRAIDNERKCEPSRYTQPEHSVQLMYHAVEREVPAGRLLWEWFMRHHRNLLLSWPLLTIDRRRAWFSRLAVRFASDTRLLCEEWRTGLSIYLELFGYKEYDDAARVIRCRDEKLKEIIRNHCENANLIVPWGAGHIMDIFHFPEELGYRLRKVNWYKLMTTPLYSDTEVQNALYRIFRRIKAVAAD